MSIARALSLQLWPLLRPYGLFMLVALLITTTSRLGLVLWQAERLEDPGSVATLFLHGARIDLSTLCYWLLPVLLAHILLPPGQRLRAGFLRLARIWLVAGLVLIAFMEVATPPFIQQYDLRPNRLFVEYLAYPNEVFGMLIGGFLPALLIGGASLLVLPALGWKLFSGRDAEEGAGLTGWQPLPALLLVLFLAVLGARGTLQHRPINPSFTAFSSDPLVNDLTLNSFYAVAFAIKAMQDEVDATALYPAMPREEVYTEVRRAMGIPPAQFLPGEIPTLHRQTRAPGPLPRFRNLVIVLEESLGAQYVGTLGGLPLTPELDALAEEGWLLERLYATGTRSVRGIEAVVTGFVPTPARSVVKLPRSQRNFFTLAGLLGARGYDTSFIYGGEGHFDNMASFFLGNGFDRVLDQQDYENPRFTGSWGVSDEDLFAKADQEFRRLHQAGKPFFSLVFSSSNHTPYEYPPGAITPVEQPANSRNNAIRYADHALGDFFRQAREADYWKETLFLIVADHDDQVYGRERVPVKHFHIPGLLLGEGLPARRDTRIVSQIDLAPTLLSLLGIEAEHPMIGRDMSRQSEDYVGRAIMQYGQNQAYMRGDRVVVLQPHQPPAHFRLDAKTRQLEPAAPRPELAREALAHALWGALAYKEGRYPNRASLEASPEQTPAAGQGHDDLELTADKKKRAAALF